MATRRCNGGLDTLCVLVCFIFFCGFLPATEGNYEALYDYEREEHMNTQNAYVKELYQQSIPLKPSIYYYGQSYDQLQVTKDGTVSFGKEEVNFSPNPRWPKGFTELTSSSDKPFIAAFHNDGYSRDIPQTYQGRIYWTKYQRKTEKDLDERSKRYQAFLDGLGKYLSHSSVTVTSFRPDVFVMVTWENVTDRHTVDASNISCTAENSNPCPSATFQLVIVANSKHTFAIFNFAKMDLAYSDTHLAGMNGGNGRGWTDVVMCQGTCRKTKQYRRIPHLLPTLQGSSNASQDHLGLSMTAGARPLGQVLGRFIFVVTDDIIIRGGCLPHGIKGAGYMDSVEVWPKQVGMLGGDIIKVSGQCQQPYSTIYCRFGQQKVTEGKISAGMVGWCPVPSLLARGHVKLEVSADPRAWRVFTQLVAVPPDHLGRPSDEAALQPWFTVNPTQLTVRWNTSKLTLDRKATVDIVLVQYKETDREVTWENLLVLAENVPNSGSFRFDPKDEKFRCRENCDDIQLGMVEIKLTHDYLEAATEKRKIVVGPVPLAWYVNHVKTEERGTEWYQEQCKEWARGEASSHPRAWQRELPPCPCTLQQALADWGRWQADVSCSHYDPGSKCTFHEGAKHCVLSVQPSAMAGGSHCCYDNNDNLMYAADSFHGSMSSRAHPLGARPFNSMGRVPALSHWLHDLIPYYYCCRWSSPDYCFVYTEHRPTRDCRCYNPPGAAAIYGDPHVWTFDGVQYPFGGAGDFWLVTSPDLKLQARFMERQSSSVKPANLLQPTYMTSLAVKGSQRDIVTFTLAPKDALHPRRLDVQVNDQHYFFDTDLTMWQDFTGLSVINNKKYAREERDRSHSNFTVILESGAGVQVAERNGLLHVVVLLPPLKRVEDHSVREPASRGLLGTWDGRKTNDLMIPGRGDTYVPLTDNELAKYNDFALQWAVKDDGEQSLFHYHNPAITDRLPPYTGSVSSQLDPEKTPSDGEVSAVCGTSERDFKNPCAYQYLVTGNSTLAIDTRVGAQAFESLRLSQKKIWSCGWLPIRLATKDHERYVAGSSVRVTGCRQGRDIHGTLHDVGSPQGEPTQYRCVQNETERQPFWEPYDDINYNLCLEDVDEASLAMIVGIAVAVAVVLAIAIIIAFILFKKRRTGKERVDRRREEVARDPGADETLVKRKPRDEGGIPMKERRQLSM